jgi:hypothetical protein
MRKRTTAWTGIRLLKLYGIVKSGNSKVQTDYVRLASPKKRLASGKKAATSQKKMLYGPRKARAESGIEARL